MVVQAREERGREVRVEWQGGRHGHGIDAMVDGEGAEEVRASWQGTRCTAEIKGDHREQWLGHTSLYK